jgi:hypothetical protein
MRASRLYRNSMFSRTGVYRIGIQLDRRVRTGHVAVQDRTRQVFDENIEGVPK